jgi:hypothetical protein
MHRFQSGEMDAARRTIRRASTDISGNKVDLPTNPVSLNQRDTGDVGVDGFNISDIAQPKHFQLQTLLAGATPEVLEAAVETGIEILEKVKIPLLEKAPDAPDAPDAVQWLQQIGK